MLSALNRLRSSNDFARVTKTGLRATTASLVIYLKIDSSLQREPQIGLIVSKAVGGSVVRHRIARQLRHVVRENLSTIPPHSQMVIRVIGKDEEKIEIQSEFTQGLSKLLTKLSKSSELGVAF